MPRWVKFVAIAFVVFFLWSRPAAAGESVRGVISNVRTGGDRLATFVTTVLK